MIYISRPHAQCCTSPGCHIPSKGCLEQCRNSQQVKLLLVSLGQQDWDGLRQERVFLLQAIRVQPHTFLLETEHGNSLWWWWWQYRSLVIYLGVSLACYIFHTTIRVNCPMFLCSQEGCEASDRKGLQQKILGLSNKPNIHGRACSCCGLFQPGSMCGECGNVSSPVEKHRSKLKQLWRGALGLKSLRTTVLYTTFLPSARVLNKHLYKWITQYLDQLNRSQICRLQMLRQVYIAYKFNILHSLPSSWILIRQCNCFLKFYY